MTSSLPLQGKVVLVTGAGLGLGGTIAQAMARQGASLVICDVDMAALHATQTAVQSLGAACLALACDVSDSAAVDRMFEQAAERFGTVDVLVNNAARIPNSPAETERRNLHYAYMTTPMPRQALGIVASLSDEDWGKPTACTLWSVKDVLAHQAGASAGHASWHEFKRQYLQNPYRRTQAVRDKLQDIVKDQDLSRYIL